MITITVILAFAVGISLGLLGGGGSVLSVPLLAYVAGWTPHQAATGSLFIVGVTSGITLASHARQGRVRWRTGLTFGAAGMVGAYAGGRFSDLVSGGVLLGSFALLMIAAGIGMIRGRQATATDQDEPNLPAALALGTSVGIATGFVGAGGGFAIVPALVLVAGLPMPAAVGTSLLVITMQSVAGFAGHLSGSTPPWAATLAITASAVIGSLVGSQLTGRIPAESLRRGFGVGVLVVAAFILHAQLPADLRAVPTLHVVAVASTVLAVVLLRSRQRRVAHHTPRGIDLTPVTDLPVLHHKTGSSRQEIPMPTAPSTARLSTMAFTQYYIDCLSQASYLVGDTSTGQAVIIDPRRDVQEYLDDAAARGLRIIGMINTHFHADFLSGHLELAAATGAWIGYGQHAKAEFETRSLTDGERIRLGDVVLEVMETPGHTPESISILVYEHADDATPYGVLTGDALFIGDVGRPDLLASIGYTADQLGKQLYHTIQHKLMGLPDTVRVFPGHGAGSACGKNLSTEKQSTIGEQRALNYACQPMSEDQFLTLVTAGQPAAPEYFVYDAILNRQQRDVFNPATPLTPLDDTALDTALANGAIILDTRDTIDFAAGHLPGSLNVPADGRFAETAGMVLTPDQPIVIIAPADRHDEVAVRLARIGFDTITGYVPDPRTTLLNHPTTTQHASRITATELADLLAGPADDRPLVLDVRNPGERQTGYLHGSLHIPLAELRRRINEIPTNRPVVVHCAGGWRSSVAASLLRRHNRTDVSDLLGGYNGWQAMKEPIHT